MLLGLEDWGRIMTPEIEYLSVCIQADSTGDIHERFLSYGRHKSGTMMFVTVIEESQISWQREGRDPSLGAYEEWGPEKWKTRES